MNSQQSYVNQENNGVLYLIPTPIGNLDDMTFRSIELLKSVDLIAAEDTRHTQKLLNHFDIQTKTISFHEHNTMSRIPELIDKLQSGMSIAQVSDAGTPSISDPGAELVKEATAFGIAVVPIPGANAAIPALIASGIAPQPFYFHGFLPRQKNDLKAVLAELNFKTETMIFYESPHRLKNMIKIMTEVFGEERNIVLARELTKKYEEFIRGTLLDINNWLKDNQLRGEFVIIVEGNAHPPKLTDEPNWSQWTSKEHVQHVMDQKDLSSKQAIKEVAKLRDVPKRDIYAAYHEI